jgi:hypothetical protein
MGQDQRPRGDVGLFMGQLDELLNICLLIEELEEVLQLTGGTILEESRSSAGGIWVPAEDGLGLPIIAIATSNQVLPGIIHTRLV